MWYDFYRMLISFTPVPPLTQNLVSQSFQACSQQLSVQVIDMSRSSNDYLCLHATGHQVQASDEKVKGLMSQ